MNVYLFAMGGRGHPGQSAGAALKYGERSSPSVVGTVTRTVTQPPRDFVRGFVRKEPKYIPIGGASEGTTATITASLRAGMQTRYLAGKSAEFAVLKAPRVALGTAKYIVRSTVRDAIITPFYHWVNFGYQQATIISRSAGRVGFLERNFEPVFMKTNKYLDRVGLAPTWKGLGGSVTRGVILGTVAKGTYSAGEIADELYTGLRKYIPDADTSATAVRPAPLPSGTGSVVVPSLPVNPSVGVPNVVPAVPAIPAAPVVPLPQRERRYIPRG